MTNEQPEKTMIRVSSNLPAVLLALGGFLHAFSAHAQARLDEVVVTGERIPLDAPARTGSRLGLTLRETPATIDVLTEEQLLELGLRDTLEALNRVPGVTSANPATSPGMLSARGFSGGAVSLLYDGARPGVPAFFTRVIDSWSFERIEVIKGPASVVHGEGALAGAVNLIPKSARLDSRDSAAQLSYGSFDSVRLAADSNLPLGDRTAVRGVASFSRSAGYVDDTGSEFFAGSVSGLWKPIDALSLSLAVDYSRDDYDTAYFGTPLVPAAVARRPSDLVRSADGRVLDEAMRDVNFNVRDGIVDSDTVWVRSGVDYRFNDAWSLRNDFDVYRSDRRFINAEFFGYDATTNLVDRSTGIVTHDFDYWIERLALAGDFEIGSLRNRITAGAEYSEVDFFTRRRFGSTTSVDPYASDRGRFPEGDDATIFPSRADNDNGIETTAIFLEDALDLTNRWLLVAGLRHDRVEVARVGANLNTGVATPVDKRFDETTWRLGTVFDLRPKTQLFVQYSTAAVPPATLFSLSPANAAFEMTTGKSVEGGIKSSFWQERINLTFAAFRIEQDDIVTRDPANPTISVQGGQQSSEGVELALSAQITPGFRLEVNASTLDARFDQLIEAGGADRRGNTPAHVPEQTANLFAHLDFQKVPLSLSGGLHYCGRWYTDNANSIRVGDHTTLEAAATYRLAFGDLTLRGRNLTDEIYADYTDISPDQLTIAAPRSVELSLYTRF
jgi:iron complex outermembrane recepter protein